jgi:hypothetical protein
MADYRNILTISISNQATHCHSLQPVHASRHSLQLIIITDSNHQQHPQAHPSKRSESSSARPKKPTLPILSRWPLRFRPDRPTANQTWSRNRSMHHRQRDLLLLMLCCVSAVAHCAAAVVSPPPALGLLRSARWSLHYRRSPSRCCSVVGVLVDIAAAEARPLLLLCRCLRPLCCCCVVSLPPLPRLALCCFVVCCCRPLCCCCCCCCCCCVAAAAVSRLSIYLFALRSQRDLMRRDEN